MLADVGVPERREVEVGALGRLEDDGAAVGGVGKDVEGLVVPEDGPVQVVRVALGVLGEDEGEVDPDVEPSFLSNRSSYWDPI